MYYCGDEDKQAGNVMLRTMHLEPASESDRDVHKIIFIIILTFLF